MNRKAGMSLIISRLRKEYPVLRSALNFRNPFELLVATMLSAQTTDAHVNKVTESLFRKYRKLDDYLKALPAEFARDISSVNFFNNKAKNILATARMVRDNFGGRVPRTMEELVSLPGVARKTANIILYNAFGITEGIAIDTHVKRLANRLGLTAYEDPVKIEKDLMAITPRKEWGDLTHLLIAHGRAVCQARKPMHDRCVLANVCPSRDI
ncbi:MAG: endonuclease III [Nitrospirae bacterium]|nr:endonuclease III [Nitrospirota bacterium]